MDHTDLYLLRETYNQKNILLCFNGQFSQGLIVEIGSALKRHIEIEESSSARDVFAIYIEIAQNIQHYATAHGYEDIDQSATVVIWRRDDGHYAISAGNVVEVADGEKLCARIDALATLDKTQLKAQYKEQLRKPREEGASASAGLGLIDMARKASEPLSCSLRPVNAGQLLFFTLRVVI